MSIIYNGTTIDTVKYNNTTLDTVKYNGTEVFSGTKTLKFTIYSGIDAVIVNGKSYTSSKTINVKVGSTVTLNCKIKDSYTTDYGLVTTYYFSRWEGYTTETRQSFTFTMPNEDVYYRCYSDYTKTMNWPSGNIPEDTLIDASVYGNIKDSSIIGRYVTLTEGTSTHDWLVINVDSTGYLLWYDEYIGKACWDDEGTGRYWRNNSTNSGTANSGYNGDNIKYKCRQYYPKLSSNVQNRMQYGINRDCNSSVPEDRVVILSAKQLGYTGSDYENDNNTSVIPYFNSNTRRKGINYSQYGNAYWTTTCYKKSSDDEASMKVYAVLNDGSFGTRYYFYTMNIIPVIKIR